MKALTEKEETIMKTLWLRGPMFVRELVETFPEPRPHFNTISTFVRILEEKGYLRHEKFGGTYRYEPTMTADEYGKSNIRTIMAKYFNNSLPSLVSALIKDEKISDNELNDIIERVKQGKES